MDKKILFICIYAKKVVLLQPVYKKKQLYKLLHYEENY